MTVYEDNVMLWKRKYLNTEMSYVGICTDKKCKFKQVKP